MRMLLTRLLEWWSRSREPEVNPHSIPTESPLKPQFASEPALVALQRHVDQVTAECQRQHDMDQMADSVHRQHLALMEELRQKQAMGYTICSTHRDDSDSGYFQPDAVECYCLGPIESDK